MAALCYPGANISLKEDVVPTLFPEVEAMLIPSIRGRQAATLVSSNVVHLSELSARVQVMSAHG